MFEQSALCDLDCPKYMNRVCLRVQLQRTRKTKRENK